MSSFSGNNSRITALLGLTGYLSALVVSACFHTHAHHAHTDGACCTVGLHAHSHGHSHGHSHSHDHQHHGDHHHSHDHETHGSEPGTPGALAETANSAPAGNRVPSPALPHRCDDCGICQFLAQASLSPSVLSLDAVSSLVAPLTWLSWRPPVPAAITVQPARGPPSLIG